MNSIDLTRFVQWFIRMIYFIYAIAVVAILAMIGAVSFGLSFVLGVATWKIFLLISGTVVVTKWLD